MEETDEWGLLFPGDEDDPDGPTQLKALAESVKAALNAVVPAGTIIASGRKTAPAGWLLCDGSPVSRTTYKRLYEAIKESGYGNGNGTSTFNLPDGRGRVFVGVDGTANRL